MEIAEEVFALGTLVRPPEVLQSEVCSTSEECCVYTIGIGGACVKANPEGISQGRLVVLAHQLSLHHFPTVSLGMRVPSSVLTSVGCYRQTLISCG